MENRNTMNILLQWEVYVMLTNSCAKLLTGNLIFLLRKWEENLLKCSFTQSVIFKNVMAILQFLHILEQRAPRLARFDLVVKQALDKI